MNPVLVHNSFIYFDTDCKCCGHRTESFGAVDYGKCCEDGGTRRHPQLTGIPIWYKRCTYCGFVFTTAFDSWSDAEFMERIYNKAYAKADPDYTTRPYNNATSLASHFMKERRRPSILDYGGGSGEFAEFMRSLGYDADSYDPFGPEKYRKPPERKYDVITSFEVFEHHPDPKLLAQHIVGLLNPIGEVLFSTLLMPSPLLHPSQFWYIAPRNGHISIYTHQALVELFKPWLVVMSVSQGSHRAIWK